MTMRPGHFGRRRNRSHRLPFEPYQRHLLARTYAYRDEAGRFDALFAEPDAVLTHTRPTTRKVKATATAAPDGAPAAPAAQKRAKPRARRGR